MEAPQTGGIKLTKEKYIHILTGGGAEGGGAGLQLKYIYIRMYVYIYISSQYTSVRYFFSLRFPFEALRPWDPCYIP